MTGYFIAFQPSSFRRFHLQGYGPLLPHVALHECFHAAGMSLTEAVLEKCTQQVSRRLLAGSFFDC